MFGLVWVLSALLVWIFFPLITVKVLEEDLTLLGAFIFLILGLCPIINFVALVFAGVMFVITKIEDNASFFRKPLWRAKK